MTASDPSWPRRAWDLGLLHKGGDPHHCPACLKQPEPPKDFICPGDNTEVLANPQPASEVAQQDAPQSATTCICQHTEQQHFEDACLVCDCGDYLEPEAAREVIARLVRGAETNRLALSEALGLGTSAPWGAIHERVGELRRLAAEASEPETGDDLIEDYLRFLRDQGPEPDLSGLTEEQRTAVTGQFEVVKALADRDPDLPSLDRDPVARRLGLHTSAAETQSDVHVYLSTGCFHGDHNYCKNMTGLNGAKRPGECKHCGAKCICLCHAGTASQLGSHSMDLGQSFEDLGDDHSCAESNCTGEPTPPVLSEEICPGFPDRCPNLRTVEPERGVHLGGVRCGCADAAPATYPQASLGAAELEEKLELDITPLTGDAFIADKGIKPQAEIVHGCPPDGSGLTPCCGRTPLELPLGDRISSEAPVTCPGPTDEGV